MALLSKLDMSPETAELFARYVVPNYTRFPVCLVRGEGSYVWDDQGRRYLDFFPGWGCNLLGHCPPRVVEAIQQQAAALIHVPNTWHTEAQGRWAQLLSERSFDGKAFFCNSGAEANEAAIKLRGCTRPRTVIRSSPLAAGSTVERTAPPARQHSQSTTKASGRCCPVLNTPPTAIWMR